LERNPLSQTAAFAKITLTLTSDNDLVVSFNYKKMKSGPRSVLGKDFTTLLH
jgi:hypothetical protein